MPQLEIQSERELTIPNPSPANQIEKLAVRNGYSKALLEIYDWTKGKEYNITKADLVEQLTSMMDNF